MKLNNIPFAPNDWASIPREEKSAEAGQAFWRTQTFGGVRVRMVEYTPGYVSEHWCTKGHVLLCLSGELHTDPARCIRCCACVKGCAFGARTFETPFAAVLSRNFARRKPPVTLM